MSAAKRMRSPSTALKSAMTSRLEPAEGEQVGSGAAGQRVDSATRLDGVGHVAHDALCAVGNARRNGAGRLGHGLGGSHGAAGIDNHSARDRREVHPGEGHARPTGRDVSSVSGRKG
ncbi:hypothetical protein [Azospirillum picis]|uniref:Uncharacterized protein n=1 Tax=Azospirillum picis TaxID=488438 RepID=A0ABU0MU22_9PROT|nr:hypothetical protein [Azospirillum picis]MBP2303228.1 hypothetical protein [Azospirillum picis]MDQ0536965.1 hypothetical protein [Azospirillum picis]